METEILPPPQRMTTKILAGTPARKVLFVIDNLLGMGGAETAVQRMVTNLPKYGYACSIATFSLASTPEFLAGFSCPIHDFTTRRAYSWHGLKTTAGLRKLVAAEGFDIIHSMFPTSDLWGGPIARAGTKARLVSGRRDLGIVRNSKHNLLYRLLRGQFDQVQAVSEAARQTCIKSDGLSPDRVFTVHNGVDMNEIESHAPHPNLRETYALSKNGPIIVSATGQLWPVKGTDIFIRAAALVCKEVPDANFLIFGWSGNQYTEDMIRLIQTLGMEKNVKIVGRIRPVTAAFKSADLMCQLSRSEGLSNALLESMACGLPAVATDVGGNPEVVLDGKTGYLVPNEDSVAAAARILDLLKNPARRLEMGRQSEQRIREHFTVDAMVSRMAQLYDNLLDA